MRSSPLQPDWLKRSIHAPEFAVGAKEMLMVTLGISAWGLVTGVAMVKSGLSVPLALLMTFTVFAGSAQLAALPLMAAGAPMWVVWTTGFCVNLRFVIFSAQWRPFFIHFPLRWRLFFAYFTADLTYVLFMKRYGNLSLVPLKQVDPLPPGSPPQIAYFLGATSINWIAWQIPSVVGILLADKIPTHWGLGFAGVLALLGVTCSLLSERSTWIALVVAGCAAVAAFALPFKLNILVAIVTAVAAGLMLEELNRLQKYWQPKPGPTDSIQPSPSDNPP
jgi:predicted branched-subunit amino acid permease